LLIPTSSVVPLADLMAERRMYLPLLSISPLIGLLLARIPRWAPAGLAALLAVLTFQRTEVWRNEESLWRDTVEKSPAKVRPKLQLARALGANSPPGREEHLRLLEEALKFAPYDPIVAEQRGAFFLESGIPDAALEEFDRAARLTPGSAQIAANRGVALYMLGRIGDAANSFRHALQLDPCNFDALHNLLLAGRQAGAADSSEAPARGWRNCKLTPGQRRQLSAVSR
jgi:tetratricopeptide (TPR) repeat protein